MKKNLLLLLVLLSGFLKAQNCTNTSVGYPPINDLATGAWRGNTGGLYPNGSNYKPAAHNAAGLNIASQIMPLDTNGNVDLINGKIVWLSVGMSNTTQSTQVFLPMANAFPQKNPKLVLIDGAQGGQDIVIISNPNANFWNVIKQRLAAVGLTSKQVQAVWFKEAQGNPTDTAFATYPDALKLKYKTGIQVVKSKFPNTKLCYLSSRTYGGYATGTLNPEPYAYYSGWSVKRLIEDQINGDTSLTYSGATPRVPWLAWGPYLWTDGTTPRADGLVWNCPTDVLPDGVHPSTSGRQKVAQLLLNFFTSDSTSTPWFLTQSTGISKNTASVPVEVFPNPVKDYLTININETFKNASIEIYNLLGEKTYFEELKSFSGSLTKRIHINSPSGIYFIKVSSAEKQSIKKFIVQ
ncbi:MAG: T9SS type A sorting domain-containing protein [Bacteroidota bacterium]